VSTDAVLSDLLTQARDGSRRALGRLLSQTETGDARAGEVDRLAIAEQGNAWVIGIVGAPGVGKSTLTGHLAAAAARKQPATRAPRVAVIAVDPSSPVTGGAILGDRVRMDAIAAAHGVFVRSMAHRGAAGGLANAVPIAVRVLGAAGVEVIIIETVGVGQVELEIAMVADTTVAVMSAGWGDAIQASKAGLLEVAEVLVVNKADQPDARAAQRDLEQMLDLGVVAGGAAGWRPPVLATVATSGEGVDALWSAIEAHRTWLERSGELDARHCAHLRHEVRGRALEGISRRLDAMLASTDIFYGPDTPDDWARRLESRLCGGHGDPKRPSSPGMPAEGHDITRPEV